ncbi:ankyrin [Cenococcum geophilum 1.58]|uniref:ankyrin n=1 Tax=Cenococcum geophilum 1.58 TaxID=794803 RepID=UPI00358FA1D1|nr:ankyrin [Cenococcum geophilum 1.58]
MKTPLHLAAHHGHFDVVSRLRAEGAGTDLPDYRGRTPLHHAARGGHVDSVQFLLKYGTSPSLRDSKGLTPLHLATRKGQVNVVECLLASMSVEDVGILSREQGTARDVAKKKGNKEIVKLIDKVVSPMDNRTSRVGDVWDNGRDSEDEHEGAPYFCGQY